ncbi:hypothetical protein [Vibrio phage phiKT1024]|nr:hypothetical protein [Vibrio phage phiKT1024]
MKKLLITIVASVAVLGLSGCTDVQGATKTLRQNGYTNVQTHGYGFFECSQNDKFATKFSATSPSGHYVTGTVCSGFFKGSTIRFD